MESANDQQQVEKLIAARIVSKSDEACGRIGYNRNVLKSARTVFMLQVNMTENCEN